MAYSINDFIFKALNSFTPTELRDAYKNLQIKYDSSNSGPTGSLSKIESAAYIGSRMSATFAACDSVLNRIRIEFPNLKIESMLDLGGGPGTATFATILNFNNPIKSTIIERNEHFITYGKTIADSILKPEHSIDWESGDLQGYNSNNLHDLIFASYSLGELDDDRLTTTVNSFFDVTKKVFIVVEPGTPKGFQTIIKVRELLIKKGCLILAPCPHLLPCPIYTDQIVSGSDQPTPSFSKWCHFRLRFNRPEFTMRVKEASLGFEDESFSYLIASPNTASAELTKLSNLESAHPLTSRIISHPRKEKGFIKCEVCTPNGTIGSKKILKRSGGVYKSALKLKWGDTLDDLS